jgi:integral membrane protein
MEGTLNKGGMITMGNTTINRFRIMGLIEGGSLLVLLFIAMPLKYGFDIPQAVSVVGALHGFLFIGYILFIAYITLKIRWSYKWAAGAVIVAFIPFGNMVFDNYLKKSPLVN